MIRELTKKDVVDIAAGISGDNQLRALGDVSMSPTVADNGKVVTYDSSIDKFVLSVDAAGIGDAPSTGLRYV